MGLGWGRERSRGEGSATRYALRSTPAEGKVKELLEARACNQRALGLAVQMTFQLRLEASSVDRFTGLSLPDQRGERVSCPSQGGGLSLLGGRSLCRFASAYNTDPCARISRGLSPLGELGIGSTRSVPRFVAR